MPPCQFSKNRVFFLWIFFPFFSKIDFQSCSSRVIISLKVVLNVNACWANSVVGISIFFLITPQPTNWCPIGHGSGPGNMQHHQPRKAPKSSTIKSWITTMRKKKVGRSNLLNCGWLYVTYWPGIGIEYWLWPWAIAHKLGLLGALNLAKVALLLILVY